MRKIFAILVLLLSGLLPANATSYFLAPASGGGNDSNNGTSVGTPWLTPNHAVNCGDVITAAAATNYNPFSFYTGSWGVVTCPAGNNVAWLKCVTFDACKITAATSAGMWVDQSYWGVQGWEVTTPQTDQYGQCFQAEPNFSTPVNIHHVIFANNIANGCGGAGFATAQGSNGTTGIDYVALVGNISYNAGSSTTGVCNSGLSIAVPKNTDTLPGTHDFVAGNYIWHNIDGNPCNGGTPTDGEGLILDTIDFFTYTGQIVVANNIFFLNGSFGLEVYLNSQAHVYFHHNTIWAGTSSRNASTLCGDLQLSSAKFTEAYLNLIAEQSATGCNANTLYAMSVASGDGTDHVYNNWAYGISGNNTQINSSPGFSYGPGNTLGTSPAFANAPASDPGPPSCGSALSVLNCAATIIANFIPTVAAAKTYGYQPVSATSVVDPLYPQWLCTVTLPAGLVTPGCVTGSSFSGGSIK